MDPPHVRLAPLIESLSSAIAGELTRAYAFFGHSLGGLIAFELARRLIESGSGPAHVFVAGCGAPHFRRMRPDMHRLPDAALLDALRRFDGLPEWVVNEPELLAIVLPTLRADLEMFETYQYRSGLPLACAITAFGGTDDRAVLPLQVAAWKALTRGPFNLRLFSGSHFFIGPHRAPLIEAIVVALTSTSKGASSAPYQAL